MDFPLLKDEIIAADSNSALLHKLEVIGVDEIACLVDFGVAKADVLASLEHLVVLKERFDID